MQVGASLTWQIVYKHRGAVALKLVKGEATAINAACKIFDAGGDVYRVESGGALTTMKTEELRQIWIGRMAAKSS